jgi:CRISPR-associated protein (TIGR02584 family)
MSPAVLTETIWALASEDPPIIPNRVFILTTIPGRKALEEILFKCNGWARLLDALKKKRLYRNDNLFFGLSGDHIRLFPKPKGHGDLEDIITAEDSHHAADFMMRFLREFTEDSETRVISSIAGGRKTMGALLTSCMTLLGRKQDRLCHVLVNPPYDSPDLEPLFLFPEQKLIHKVAGSEKFVPSTGARIELTDIPFVRARAWYEKEHGHAPPSYMSLVRLVRGLTPEDSDLPPVTIDMNEGRVWIGETETHLSHIEFGFFSILAKRIKGKKPIGGWMDLEKDIRELQASGTSMCYKVWIQDFMEKKFESKEDPRKLASSIRKKIGISIGDKHIIGRLIFSPKSGNKDLYPAAKIIFKT